MKTVCQENMCTGCSACVDSCPRNAVTLADSMKSVNAVVDETACISCGLCEKVCQKREMPALKQPMAWQQGWAADAEIRKRSSSGGAAAAIARAFAENGGTVCSCVFRDGEFRFEFAEAAEQTQQFIGSKYVKSNPSGSYAQIRTRLKQGQKVLFIGLPCQVGALKKTVGEAENLYTVDLICHGTPSVKLLERFLEQNGKLLSEAAAVEFRRKQKKQVIVDNQGIAPIGVSDRYAVAFLEGLTFTDNCYACDYAGIRRVSDVTLGDAYGSSLSEAEQKQGISLILCQTEKGKQLVQQAQLICRDIDLEQAVAHNGQLAHPYAIPAQREAFWKGTASKEPLNKLIFRAFPKACLRQDAKEALVRLKLIR